MQTVWSRAVQAQSTCRCRTCLHSTHALARRSTTFAPKRRVSVADIFTACYTTILGTATIIDHQRKEKKRRELDGQLDRARASLNQSALQYAQGCSEGEDDALDEGASTPKRLPTYLKGRAGNASVRPLLEELKALYNITYHPIGRQWWMQDQVDWADIEVAVAAEEQDPNAVVREPQGAAQLSDTASTILRLADVLIQQSASDKSERPQDQVQVPDAAGEAVFKELEELIHGNDFPGYRSPFDDVVYTARIRDLLNKSIRRIFNQAVTSRETVGRICYNLITAGVSPTIHTYNTLIAGFNRMQRPDLAQTVIDSYLEQTKWPATEQTLVCLLNHYRGPGGREGMRDIVQRMRGAKEDGLHLASLHEDRYNQTRLFREERHVFFSAGRVPKFTRTDETFDRLIRGWLYHQEVDIACMTFVASLRNGASIPANTLQELFRGCLATANFSNARKLVIGIIKNLSLFKVYLSVVIENNTTTIARQILQSLRQIITICWLPFGEIYGWSWRKYGASTVPLKSMISRLDMQLEAQDTTRLFDALHSSEPLLTRLEDGNAILDEIKLNRRPMVLSDRAYTSVARLASIARRCGDLEQKTRVLIAAANAIIIDIQTSFDVDRRSVLLSDPYRGRVLKEQRFALSRALNEVDLYDTSLTMRDITSQLFWQIPNSALIDQLGEHGNWKRVGIRTLISLFGHDATTPRKRRADAFDHPYRQLELQVRAMENSIRALVFTHLPENRQKRSLYYYGSYYRIPFGRLVGYLNTAMKYHLPQVAQVVSQHDRHLIPHDALKALSQSALRIDGSASGVKREFKNGLAQADPSRKPGSLDLIREDEPHLPYAGLE